MKVGLFIPAKVCGLSSFITKALETDCFRGSHIRISLTETKKKVSTYQLLKIQ